MFVFVLIRRVSWFARFCVVFLVICAYFVLFLFFSGVVLFNTFGLKKELPEEVRRTLVILGR